MLWKYRRGRHSKLKESFSLERVKDHTSKKCERVGTHIPTRDILLTDEKYKYISA
jgi:hypothetical protein